MAKETATSAPSSARTRGRRSVGGDRLRAAWSRLRRAAARVPHPLALIMLLAALQAVAWNVSVPALQGPDEAAQFAYLQHFAETGQIPSTTSGSAPASTEEKDAMYWLNLGSLVGDLGARPAWSAADLAVWHRIERAMPSGSRANGSGPNYQAANPPLYYALMAVPYRLFVWLPLLKRLFVLRLFSALFFLATVALTWLLAGEIFTADRWKQTLATAVVALQPKLAFMGAVISADSLLITAVTAFLLACVRLVRRGPSTRRVLVASVLAGAAVLTQGRGLVTVPVLAVALAVAWIRYRPAAAARATQAVVAVASVAVAVGAYALFLLASHGGAVFGGQVTTLNSGRFDVAQFLAQIYQFYFSKLPGMTPSIGPAFGYPQVFIQSFYGTFGSLEVVLSPLFSAALQVLSGLGLLGLWTACVVRRRRLREAWPAVAVMLALLLTTLGLLHYVSYRALLDDGGGDPLITGRYLLPLVSLLGLGIAFTVGSLPRRVAPFAAAVILALGAVLSLDAIGTTIVRFYA